MNNWCLEMKRAEDELILLKWNLLARRGKCTSSNQRETLTCLNQSGDGFLFKLGAGPGNKTGVTGESYSSISDLGRRRGKKTLPPSEKRLSHRPSPLSHQKI